jgi:fumarylacetoacetate (FAA) hydrolase
LPLLTSLNGEKFGRPRPETICDFIYYGDCPRKQDPEDRCRYYYRIWTVSNLTPNGRSNLIKDVGNGYSSLGELRMVETIANGVPKTPFLSFGDKIRIECSTGSCSQFLVRFERTVKHYRPSE